MARSRIHVPLSSEISAAMKVAGGSVEASNYFVERLTKILTETKMLDKSADLLVRVHDFAKYVEFKLNSSAQPWSGESPKISDFENMQDHLANDAIRTVKANALSDVKLDIAINESAQLLRGYSAEGEWVKDPVVVDALDKIFNAWLAQHNVVSSSSVLYEANALGEIKRDASGDVHADVEKIKSLMSDPDKGLTKFSADKGLEIAVDNSHSYPAQESKKETATVTVSETQEEPSQPQKPT